MEFSMRYFLSKRMPLFERVLLVESGSRQLFEDLLRGLYDVHAEMRADLVTCYAGVPEHYRTAQGQVYRVTDYRDSRARQEFYAELAGNRYDVILIICSAEPIMTKWKLMLAARLRAKLLILNENGDYFWFDRGHAGTIAHFILFRAGLSGAGAVRTLARLTAFPFALLYLILFAATVHLRRKLRTL
jgi:hypothetical protein